MLKKIGSAVATAGLLVANASMALAQSGPPPKSTGPSGSQVMGDLNAWFAQHQGAAIAIAVIAVLTVGYLAYGYLKPKGDK